MALVLAGCQGKSKAPAAANAEGGEQVEKIKVPAGAEVISSGRGNIARVAGARGTIYVVDGKTDEVIYAGPIQVGQRVILFGDAGQLVVNGQTIQGVHLVRDRNYKVYFSRG